MANLQTGMQIRVADEWSAPNNSAYGDAGSTLYAGESGVIDALNTMGEAFVRFDRPELGSHWIADDDCHQYFPRTDLRPVPRVILQED